jgi:hypothetical protein
MRGEEEGCLYGLLLIASLICLVLFFIPGMAVTAVFLIGGPGAAYSDSGLAAMHAAWVISVVFLVYHSFLR